MKFIYLILLCGIGSSLGAQVTESPASTKALIDSTKIRPTIDINGKFKRAYNGDTWVTPVLESNTLTAQIANGQLTLASSTDSLVGFDAVTTTNIAAGARIKIQSDGTEWFSIN